MPLHRNYARYGAETTFFRSVDDFIANPIFDDISAIQYGNSFLELLIQNANARTTIVLFHAAVDPHSSSLPVFVGRNLVSELEANIVYVSEPALDKGVSIGWFAGAHEHDLQRDLTRIIEHIHSEITNSQNLIFFGSSAGGFAAMYYSHAFENSLAIVSNPQTNIAHYFAKGVEAYLTQCWQGCSITEIPATTNLVELYSDTFPNHVLYFQNQDDELHLTKHFHQWRDAVHASPERWTAVIGDWGPGHYPPPAVAFMAVLGAAVEANGNWEDVLCDPELQDLANW